MVAKPERQADFLYRGLLEGGTIRLTFARLTALCETACLLHDTDPAGAVCFAQALLSSALVIPLLDKESLRATFRWNYDGALGKIITEVTSDGAVRGLIETPQLSGLAQSEDELFGETGVMSQVRSDPKTGAILTSGTVKATMMSIPDDLAMLFCISEQVETEILTAIHFQDHVEQPFVHASGLLLQAMPGADLQRFDVLRRALKKPEVKAALGNDLQAPEEVMTKVLTLSGFSPDREGDYRQPPRWQCSCSRERLLESIKTLARSDLDHIFAEKETVHVNCQFCKKAYTFCRDDFKN